MNGKRPAGSPWFSLFVLVWMALGGLATGESEVMDIVDKQGRSMKGALILSDGTTVSFAREPDKKSFTVPLATLSDATQGEIRSWIGKGGSQVEKFEVSVETGKNRRKTTGEDFDDKRVNLEPQIIVKNPNSRFVSRKAKMTALFLGRPVDSVSDIYVLKSTTFDIPQFQPLASQVFDAGRISQAYDTKGYGKFGSRYLGYVILIHDDGKPPKIHDSCSIPAPLLGEHGRRWITLKTGATYDRNLLPMKREVTE